MAATAKFRGIDYSNESTSFGAYLGVTDLDNTTLDGVVTDLEALQTALGNFTLIPMYFQLKAVDEPVASVASNEYAQRESKARVRYQDDVTGARYAVEVPGPILTGRLVAGSQFFDLAQAQVAAFVTAFEAVVKAPGTDNAVSVINIQHVGRSI